MSEQRPFINRLKRVLPGERQKSQNEPTPEQVRSLHRMREILLTEDHPGMQLLNLTEVWYEHMASGSPSEKLELINSLYQKVAGNPEVSFQKDFPVVAQRFKKSFNPPSDDLTDLSQIPDFELSPLERFDKYVNEYLENLQPIRTLGEQITDLLPPTESRQ